MPRSSWKSTKRYCRFRKAPSFTTRTKRPPSKFPIPKGKEGKKKVAVNIGISNGAKTELLGGLKEGDQVVLQ